LQLQLQVGKYSTVGHEFNLAGSTPRDEEKGEGKTFRVDKVGRQLAYQAHKLRLCRSCSKHEVARAPLITGVVLAAGFVVLSRLE